MKHKDYNVNIYEPIDKRCSETINYFLDLGKKLKIDENYHVYFGNKWIADARPKKNKT